MKNSHYTELLVLLATAISTMIVLSITQWYWSLLIGTFVYAVCSYLIGILKRQTAHEAIDAVYKEYYFVKRRKKK